jgi:dipeptidyl aminopeptidase/acylaminoacyl peptidase
MQYRTLRPGHWLAILLLVGFGFASTAQKRNLTEEDYGKWHSLGMTGISDDGNWIHYAITYQEDNDTIHVKHRTQNTHYKLAHATQPAITPDGKWIVYRIGLPYKEAQKAQEANRPIEYKLGIMNLSNGQKEEIAKVSAYRLSEDGKFLAIYLNKPQGSKDKGSTLLLRDLNKGTTRSLGNVTEYSFNKKGDRLAFITDTEVFRTVEMVNLVSQNQNVIASDTAAFSKLTWHKEGTSLAFYQEMKHDKFKEESQKVHFYTGIYGTPTLRSFDHTAASGFPEDMRILGASSITIAKDETGVFFGIQPWTPKDTVKKAPNNEKLPGVDVWHYADKEIQPRQKITFGQDRNRSHLAVWWANNNRFVRIGDDNQPSTSLSEDHKMAIALNPDDYKPAFKEDYADYFIVDTRTGTKTQLHQRKLSDFNAARVSPGGKFIVYYEAEHWHIYNVATGSRKILTQGFDYPLYDIREDRPRMPSPYGLAAFTKDDKEVIIYDQYDAWLFSTDGKTRIRLTDGRKDEVVYRLNRLDMEESFVDLTQPQYFSMYGDKSKKFGYAVMDARGRVTPLMYEFRSVGRLAKAKNANAFTYVTQRYEEAPAMYVTDQSFRNPQLVVQTNPQQADFNWGKSELVSFTNADGKELQAALIYPANYEPGKKYPMVVYIYEILSNGVHSYTNPSIRSAYNLTNFSQKDYFVLRPDIVYDIDDPGVSAVKCVVPAVEKMLSTGMVDRDKLALMGHSWGAYQTSFIITQTDLFAGAVAGAPLTDMISMSLNIYWNSGTPDQKIFETSQGRFSGPWYEQYEAHKRNSPIYHVQNTKTPLLVAFGDKDGAVDWQQGIAMYGTMRRMELPHVLLVYEGENHSLAKRENQIDYTRRMNDWFDHYVLGKEPASWIINGTTYLEKMKAREGQNGQQR